MLFQDKNDDVIRKDEDIVTFQKITTLLCEKRENIEKNLHEENKQELLNLIEEMKTFGVTELDYQKYLITKKDSAPSLFS